MKGAGTVRSIIIVVILILVGVLGVLGVNTAKTYLSGASADTEPKNVMAKPNEDGKSATVSWSSDKATTGVVEYGTTPASLLLRAPETDSTTSHSVVLSPLKSGVNYYFRIRVGEELFDNNGIPYSFKTEKGQEKPTVTPKKVEPTAVKTQVSCQQGIDYNKDGATNSLDMIECLKTSKTSPTGTGSTGKCPTGVDYNKDGVVNSLDRLKCLQNSQ